jgi:hypothetical protein
MTPHGIRSLIDALDWSQVEGNSVVTTFLESVEASFTGRCFKACYFEALLSVKDLTRVALQQFKAVEDTARTIESQELTLKDIPDCSVDPATTSHPSFIEINQLLSALVDLEDQLY